MSVRVRQGDPRSPEARALLGASQALLASLYPAEHNHALSVDELAAPHVTFWLAEAEREAAGCVALARMEGFGEVKSLFVDGARRGAGVGRELMVALEELARAEGIVALRLETGDALDAARRLYARQGFAPRGPFGAYAAGPHSLFMEKVLA